MKNLLAALAAVVYLAALCMAAGAAVALGVVAFRAIA